MRDFAGTDVFGAEFITFSKRVKNHDLTVGFGYGGLSGNSVGNPLRILGDRFKVRQTGNADTQGGEPDFRSTLQARWGIFAGFETILQTPKD